MNIPSGPMDLDAFAMWIVPPLWKQVVRTSFCLIHRSVQYELSAKIACPLLRGQWDTTVKLNFDTIIIVWPRIKHGFDRNSKLAYSGEEITGLASPISSANFYLPVVESPIWDPLSGDHKDYPFARSCSILPAEMKPTVAAVIILRN